MFMKFRILLDHWRKKTFLYQKYKSLEEYDKYEVFKKLSFISGFSQSFRFTCPVCDKQGETILDLRRHFASKHLLTEECCFCDKWLTSKESLESHISEEHKSEIWFSSSTEFKCIECDISFTSDYGFLKHVDNFHVII